MIDPLAAAASSVVVVVVVVVAIDVALMRTNAQAYI
jgi:hypothetical protein